MKYYLLYITKTGEYYYPRLKRRYTELGYILHWHPPVQSEAEYKALQDKGCTFEDGDPDLSCSRLRLRAGKCCINPKHAGFL